MAAVLLVACKGNRTLPSPVASTPVFIISIDTLRSDHLPAYGYKTIETPHIDAFRADAVLYEHAYSQYPLTLPSHTSILTGRLPADHGIRDNTGFRLRPDVQTLPEMLHARGYVTGAAVSTFILRRETGINRGFDFFDDAVTPLNIRFQRIGAIQRDGAETQKVAVDWIDKQTKPIFFLLHLYEPHTPYLPPEPYRSRYSLPYDGEIAHVDEIVGEYLQFLKSRGLYDKSLIILLSDHGEGLNEHGEEEHGMFLYREALQVPLMVKLPDSKFGGASVSTPVQLVDVVPTVLDRLGIAPPAGLPGRSLASFIVDKTAKPRSIYSESYYTRFHYGWSAQHSLIDGAHHYIDTTRAELFDVTRDPHEKTNILQSDRRTYFAMKQALQPLIREASAPEPANAEETAKLAALGYLGSTVQTKPGEVLPDPKDHIQEVQQVSVAFAKYYQRKYAESLATLEPLLQRNPKLLDLWDLKSKTLARLGRLPEAVEASKTGLRLSPRADYFALDVATLQLDLGNLDDAEKHAELAVDAAPAQAYELLARVWIARKDFARAEAEARKAIEKDQGRIASMLTMARIQRERGKYDEALTLLDQAVRKKKPHEEVAGLFFMRGDVMARLGRVEEAEADFRREIKLFPEDPPAYKNLVLLLVAEGRSREGAQLIRNLIAEAPVPASYLAVCEVLKTVGDVRGVRYWARQGLLRYPNDRALTRIASS